MSDSAKLSLVLIKDSYLDLFLIERREIKLDIEGLGAETSCSISSMLRSMGINLRSLFSRKAETLLVSSMVPLKLSGRKNDYDSPI
jgi:hypothetical protein